jgi:hypothetical protein
MKTLLTIAKLFAGAVLASTAAHTAVLATFTSSILATDPTELGRLSRNAIPQDWSGTETFPGVLNGTTVYHYKTFTVNVGAASFIQIDLDDSGTATFGSAYDTAYLPNSAGAPNLGYDTNWLGDAGTSGNFFGIDPLFFQVIVPQNHNLVVVVNDPNAGTAGLGEPFTLTVEGFSDANFDPPTPEPSTFWIGGACLALLICCRRFRSPALR